MQVGFGVVRVSLFCFLRVGICMCLSPVKGNQMEVTRVSQCLPEVCGKSSSVLFTLPTAAKLSLQRFQKLSLWAQQDWAIWLTLTKWIDIGGIHTSGWERICALWACFAYGAFRLFAGLTKGQNLDIIVNSWLPESKDCLYKAHQKKRTSASASNS